MVSAFRNNLPSTLRIYFHCSEPDVQLQRLLTRNELSPEDARKRIESQMPLEKKCEKSNFVIENNGSIEDTEAAALQICNLMKESNHHWLNRLTFLGLIGAFFFVLYYLNKVFNILPLSK